MADSDPDVAERLRSGETRGGGRGRHRSLWERTIAMAGVTFLAAMVGNAFYDEPRGIQSASDAVTDLIVASELGFLVIAIGMLAVADFEGELGLTKVPALSTILRDVLAVALALAAVSVGVVALLADSGTGVGPVAGGLAEDEAAEILAAMIPLSLVLVAPIEELYFRGVVQRHLRVAAGPGWGVGVAAGLFALVHLPQYFHVDSGLAILLMLGVIFGVGYAAGRVYDRTGSLPAAIGVHATYNCTIAGVWYLEVTRGLLPL